VSPEDIAFLFTSWGTLWFVLALIGCAISGWGACQLLRVLWRLCREAWAETVNSGSVDPWDGKRSGVDSIFDGLFLFSFAALLGAAGFLMFTAMALGTAAARVGGWIP
jgi:hypothetical protein